MDDAARTDPQRPGRDEADMTIGGTSEISRVRRWAILATMLSGTMLAILDSSILTVLVVPMMEEFKADLRTVEWVLTSYNLAFAVFLIGFGSLGDMAGRRRLYVWGQMVFVLGSGLAAVANGPWQLIAFRAIQGLGAAALAPNALALILDHFPEGERGAALGIWGAAAGLGGALGPTVGGMVAQTWGWRVLFLLNLPVGLLVMAAAYVLLVPDPPWRGRHFDTRGFFLLSAALLALSLALTGATDLGSSWGKAGVVALALLLGVWFVRIERHAPQPLIDFGAILRRDVIAANLSVFVALLIMAGGMFLTVLYAQLLADASPAEIGALVAPCAAMTVLIAPVGGWLADKVDPRVLTVSGLLALAASVAIPMRWSPAAATSLVFWSNLLAGTGIGLATPPLIRASTESVGRERSGLGAGVYKMVNELGGIFGIVLLGAFLEARIVANVMRLLPNHFLPQELSLKALTSLTLLENHALQKGLPLQDLQGVHQSLVQAVQLSFEQAFGLAALLAGVGVVMALLSPRRIGAQTDGSLPSVKAVDGS
jgi:EmrB/QacA subfamily drug resistance transporter